MNTKLVVLVAYILIIAGVIVLTARKSLSLNDFLLGGRKVGPWMSALSFGASYFSAVIIVGYAGSMGFQYGIASSWSGIGNALIGSLLAWALLAKPTRLMGERLNVGTIPSFFDKRYLSKGMKIASSLIIFVFLLPYTASVYKGLGIVFQKVLGFDYTWCVIGIAMLASVYLFAGGYRATAITDFIQGIIMFVGVILLVAYLIRGAGGLTEGLAELGRMGGFNQMLPASSNDRLNLFSNVILTSLGTLGLPQMIHKFFAIRDASSVKRATVISTVFAFVIAGGVYFAGGFGRVILTKMGVDIATVGQAGGMRLDEIMPSMMVSGTVGIPDALQGLIVVLLLSASVSTMTSLVLASSSVLSIDLLGTFMKNRSQKNVTFTMRALCVAFVMLSLVIHFLMQNTPIVQLMSLSWGVIAGAFLAPFLYGLLWKGTTRVGAFVGMVAGALIGGVPPLVLGTQVAPISGAAAMLSGLVIVPVVSALTRSTCFAPDHLAFVFGKAAPAPIK